MGSKVALIKEIYTRLNSAIASGKPLAEVKRVQVGGREEARLNNDLPIINLSLSGGEETAYCQPNRKRDLLTIEISLIVSKPDLSIENHLFSSDGTTGALVLFEKLLDVVDKTALDVIDLTFGDTAGQIPEYSYDVNYLSGLIEFVFTIDIETAEFTVGAR